MGLGSWLHVITVGTSLISGLFIFSFAKIGKRHRWLGKVYVTSMVTTNISALTIFTMGGITAFHVLAVISLTTVVIAFVLALKRPRGWLRPHSYLMAYSYVGLVAAGFSRYADGILEIGSIPPPLSASLLTFFIGSMIINMLLPRTLQPGSLAPKRS